MRKKLVVVVGAVVAVVVVLVVAAFALVNPKQLVAAKKDELLATVSSKIGRTITAGDVTASVGGELTARITNLQVAGAAGQKPQVELGALDVRFSLLKALLSFGKNLEVEKFTVTNLTLRAARDDEGRWDFQDVLDKLSADSTPDAQPKQASTSSPLDGVRIASVSIKDARVELDDKMLGRPLAVTGIDIDTSDVEIGKALDVKLKAVLEDAAKKSPVDVDAKLAVLPQGLNFDPLPDVSVKANADGVDLAPWGGLAPGDVPAPVSGALSLHVDVSAKNNLDLLDVDGTITAKQVVLRDAVSAVATQSERASAPKGAPLDADLAVKLDVDQKKPHYEVKKLTLKGNGLDVDATVDASGTSLAALDKADVKASAQDLDKILAVLPPSLRGLPDAVKLEGPLSAKLSSNGSEISAGVNLDAMHVRYLATDDDGKVTSDASFDKAAGKALHVDLHGKRTSTQLDVDNFALVLDNAKIGGTLSLPTAKDAPFSADIASGPIELASLQGLVPPFKEAIGKGQKVDGVVEVKVKASSEGGKQKADAGVELKSLDVNLANTTVKGAGAITAKAEPGGDEVHVVVDADFSGLSVQKRGADGKELVVNKTAGLPLKLGVDAKKSKTKVDVSSVELAIGKSTIHGHGIVANLDKDTPALDVDLGDVALGFDDLRAAVPGASKLPAGGSLHGKVKLSGGTSAKSLVVDANALDLAFGKSKIAGDVHVKDLSAPDLDVDLKTVDVNFADVKPLVDSVPSEGAIKATVALKGNTAKSSTVQAHVKIDSLTTPGSSMHGNIDVENLDKPKFALALDAENLDVDKLRAALSSDKPGEKAKDEPKKPAKAQKDDNPHGLSKATRALLANTNGKGTITAKHAIVKGMPLENFKGALVVTRGVARFDALDFGLFGGTMSAAGSSFDLPSEKLGYDLKLKGKDVDFGEFVAHQTSLGKVFTGKLSPDVDVKGKGIAAGDFAITAEGPAALSFNQLELASLDLEGAIVDAFNNSAKGAKGAKASSSKSKGLAMQGFKAATQLAGGKMKLEKPVETDTALGKITWTGNAGLDAGLDLQANVALAPAVIGKMMGNKVKPASAVNVPVKIGGTWDKPRITGVDVVKLVESVVGAAAGNAVKNAEKDVAKDLAKGGAKDAAKDIAKDALGALGGGGKDKGKKDEKKNAKDAAKEKGNAAKKAADAAANVLKGFK